MVIFESRPDALPQVASLAISSANGLLLKGGKEAINTNTYLLGIVKEALGQYGCADSIAMVKTIGSHKDKICVLLRPFKAYSYKSVQSFRVTCLFTGQYNTGEYGTIAGVI